MIVDLNTFLASCLTILYFLLPAYLSNSGGLIFGGRTPVDMGKIDNKGTRWIGNGVTWKGFVGGTILGTLIGAVQGYFGPMIISQFHAFIYTPIVSNVYEGIIVGFLLSFGALLGDAVGSFIKRRIGIKRGEPAPLLDQLDFLAVAILFASIVIPFNLYFIIVAIILTLIIHLLANTIAYLIGMKNVWY